MEKTTRNLSDLEHSLRNIRQNIKLLIRGYLYEKIFRLSIRKEHTSAYFFMRDHENHFLRKHDTWRLLVK